MEMQLLPLQILKNIFFFPCNEIFILHRFLAAPNWICSNRWTNPAMLIYFLFLQKLSRFLFPSRDSKSIVLFQGRTCIGAIIYEVL